VNATPVAGKLRSKLDIVKFRVTLPPGATGSSVNDFCMARDVAVTSNEALAFPLIVKSANKLPVMLSCEPIPVPTTSTKTIHSSNVLSDGNIEVPLASSEITFVPGTAINVPPPDEIQFVDALFGLAISIPAGRISVKSRFRTLAVLCSLSIMNVRVLLSPKNTDVGAKLLLNPGREVLTSRLSVAVPLLPADEVRLPVRFVCVPITEDVTFTVITHEDWPLSFPPEKLIVFPPLGASNIPSSHVDDALAGAAIVTSIGNTSVKVKSVTGDASLLIMVNVMVVTLPGPISFGANSFENSG